MRFKNWNIAKSGCGFYNQSLSQSFAQVSPHQQPTLYSGVCRREPGLALNLKCYCPCRLFWLIPRDSTHSTMNPTELTTRNLIIGGECEKERVGDLNLIYLQSYQISEPNLWASWNGISMCQIDHGAEISSRSAAATKVAVKKVHNQTRLQHRVG